MLCKEKREKEKEKEGNFIFYVECVGWMFIEHGGYCYQVVAKLIWRSCGRIGNWKVKRK